ncbi:hypothetical protein Ga0074812_11172 [Parafrankia irregularis]|uniref:Uncharacterized protein n=1 Tax=Parafrankia irregularis TaxID=795642 RepID=A0A0S4QPK1_9ACTN|nr:MULTISPECIES: hypothetical protein [Parafrankia]MBE3204265.1 hypothetical protein [Parafrankia sp. CH37]CUU57236.1 hypothetical protein Ga0074812_11172 [Parafrankia irregularis]
MAGRPVWLRTGFRPIAEPPLSPAATGAALVGALTLVVGCVLVGGSEEHEVMATAAPAEAAFDTSELTNWYQSTQGLRASIATTVAAVRGYLEAQDGAGLQPRCTQLAAETKAANRLPAGPDPQANGMFTGGIERYAAAAQTCAHLFDGTQVPLPELQSQLRTALADGDTSWESLSLHTGLPLAQAGSSTVTSAGSGGGTRAAGGAPATLR